MILKTFPNGKKIFHLVLYCLSVMTAISSLIAFTAFQKLGRLQAFPVFRVLLEIAKRMYVFLLAAVARFDCFALQKAS